MPALVRRILPVLALGGASGVLVMALDHPGAGGSVSVSGLPGEGAVSVSDSGSATTAARSEPTSSTGPASGAGVPADAITSSTVTTSVPAVPSTSGVPASQATPDKCQLYNGPTQWHRFGPLQVQAAVTGGGRICSVKVVQEPGDRRSRSINDWAVPILVEQSIGEQTASVDVVSGATLTSVAYAASLQAIIDAATR